MFTFLHKDTDLELRESQPPCPFQGTHIPFPHSLSSTRNRSLVTASQSLRRQLARLDELRGTHTAWWQGQGGIFKERNQNARPPHLQLCEMYLDGEDRGGEQLKDRWLIFSECLPSPQWRRRRRICPTT